MNIEQWPDDDSRKYILPHVREQAVQDRSDAEYQGTEPETVDRNLQNCACFTEGEL